MKKYRVFQWINERKEDLSNERSIRLERIAGPEMKDDTAKKLDEKSLGISKMLQQLQREIMTAEFNTETEAMAYIGKLEREETPGSRKE